MKPTFRNSLLLALMLLAAGLAYSLSPRTKLADSNAPISLEQLIPQQFGDWRMDSTASLLVVNPQQEAFLSTIYSQTLSRTYIHTSGRRIMLSLAYGGDQSHDTQIHKPEVCYPAQGFRITSTSKSFVSTNEGDIPVMRVVAELGNRHEPVTYWIRVGDSLVRGSIEQNLARIQLGLNGYIPDGILFRVSEISKDSPASFMLQDTFIRDVLSSISPSNRKALLGTLAKAG
jgi:EpsI family protein